MYQQESVHSASGGSLFSPKYRRSRISIVDNIQIAASPFVWFLCNAKRHGILISRYFRKERVSADEWNSLSYPLPTLTEFICAFSKVIARFLNCSTRQSMRRRRSSRSTLDHTANDYTPDVVLSDALASIPKISASEKVRSQLANKSSISRKASGKSTATTGGGGGAEPAAAAKTESPHHVVVTASSPDIFEQLKANKLDESDNQDSDNQNTDLETEMKSDLHVAKSPAKKQKFSINDCLMKHGVSDQFEQLTENDNVNEENHEQLNPRLSTDDLISSEINTLPGNANYYQIDDDNEI